MDRKKLIISTILNAIIGVFVIFSVIAIVCGWNFMSHSDIKTGVKSFRYFTVDSNIVMGLSALFTLYFDILLLKNKIEELPKYVYVVKLIGTVGVTLTFLVVIFFLYPTTKDFTLLFMDANLFMHVLTPVLAIIVFIFLEKTNTLKLKDAIIGISFMGLYSIYYSLNVILHSTNGEVSGKYDFYGFLFGKLINAIFVIPLMLLITFGISYLIVVLNKLKTNKK